MHIRTLGVIRTGITSNECYFEYTQPDSNLYTRLGIESVRYPNGNYLTFRKQLERDQRRTCFDVIGSLGNILLYFRLSLSSLLFSIFSFSIRTSQSEIRFKSVSFSSLCLSCDRLIHYRSNTISYFGLSSGIKDASSL